MKPLILKCGMLITSFLFSFSLSSIGQNIVNFLRKPEKLRENVVLIRSSVGDGSGFLVGENQENYYVVTAAHVVSTSSLDNNIAKKVNVFFGPTIESPSKEGAIKYIRSDWEGNIINDISLIEIPKQELNLNWYPGVLSQKIKRDMKVSYIDGNTSTPTDIGKGSVFSVSTTKIEIDFLQGIGPGSSGSPLLSKSGIVGMIISQSNNGRVEVLNIEEIERFIAEETDLKNCVYILHPSKRNPIYSKSTSGLLFLGGFTLAYFGNESGREADIDYQIYKNNPNPNDPIFESLGTTRSELYEDSNRKHKNGEVLKIIGLGVAVGGIASYFILPHLSYKKQINKTFRERGILNNCKFEPVLSLNNQGFWGGRLLINF